MIRARSLDFLHPFPRVLRGQVLVLFWADDPADQEQGCGGGTGPKINIDCGRLEDDEL